RICGLARVLRGAAVVGLENVALWHERDISHSSAERVVLPDAFLALDYMLDRFTWLMEGLVVREERMRRNIEASHYLFFSQRVLLALVESGLARDDDRLLLVASDRISTFDVILPTEIPDKGRVLTGLSGFWFTLLHAIVPNHMLSIREDGRSMECRRLEMLPIECVVRGHLAGS